MAEKKESGPVEVFLTRDLFNSLVSVLSAYIQADENNRFSQYAIRLKKKIMNYGREFVHDNQPNVVIYFYPEEAALLIKLFVMYNNAIEDPSQDFFKIFHNNKLENKKYEYDY